MVCLRLSEKRELGDLLFSSPNFPSLGFGDGGKSCDCAVVSHARVAFATIAICEGETKGCEVAEGESPPL